MSAPSPSDPPPDAPVAFPITGELDLHTFRPRDVGELVPAYLDACVARGITQVRIIHGKGTGTLRETVHTLAARRTCGRFASAMRRRARGAQRW